MANMLNDFDIQKVPCTICKNNIPVNEFMFNAGYCDSCKALHLEIPVGTSTEDLINKPNHYHKGGIDIYEIMQAKLSKEEYNGFCKGNILKYVLREDLKGGVDDIKKLKFNAERLIENMQGIKYVPQHKIKSGEKING